jgi:hypothetical protein
MPLLDIPFATVRNGQAYPLLPIHIGNPATGQSISTWGIIDTGADECAVPAGYAPLLGHNLLAGQTKDITTGNGVTAAYAHTSVIEIIHPATGVVAYTVPQTPIDFLPNLHIVLLGVKSFLSQFLLRIDYPRQVFSIKKPS